MPGYFAALRFVGECFGVGEAEMTTTLKRVRGMGKRSKKRNKHFPRKLTREMLGRAELGVGRWNTGLATVGEEALCDRILRQDGAPLFGASGDLAEKLAFGLLRLYEKIAPRLNADGVSARDVLWVLVEEVFVPTLFVELALNWQRGLGTEFQLESCWYLPMTDRGERLKPVARVLKCWFRAAGFRGTHDFSKQIDDSFRKKIDGWLKGELPRYLGELHKLVNKFADDVRWLDSPDSWKSRFTVARATQKFCDAMDGFFGPERRDSSLRIVEMLRGVQGDGVPVDDGHILADRFVFFAARLLKRQLVREKRWTAEVESLVQETLSRKWPEDPSQDDQFRVELYWGMNAGNWFLKFIEGELGAEASGDGKQGAGTEAGLQERLLDVAVVELNRILDEKRGQQANARRP